MASSDFIDNIINESFNNYNESDNNDNNNNKSKQLINDDVSSLKDYELIIFTDGGHERVKKRTSFGIYLQCMNTNLDNMKFNKMKIIKKITKDTLLYNIKTKKILQHSIFNSNNNNICEFSNCNYFAIYNESNQSNGKLCKIHKNHNMEQIIQFDMFEPSNIRAEGYGILYTLILLTIIHKPEFLNKSKECDINKIVNNINNISLDNFLHFEEYKYYSYNFKLPTNNYKKYLIITDSEFWINVITKWSNNWIKKNLVFEKKNIDLVYHINYYLNILYKNNILIDFKFIRAHSDKNKTTKLNLFQKGNVMADKLANIAKENTTYNVKIAL